ncbi:MULTISPECIES: hypothetical protein [Ponticoccus]|uniref:Uncharacterized protein n=1 Tax=Ponticoccus litoralis TaxID=422297 RepID=A0AAW9SNW5_9RHOB
MFTESTVTGDMREVESFLLAERQKVLSEAEWRFRMRGYGYNLRRTEGGVEVARLPKNEVLGVFSI